LKLFAPKAVYLSFYGIGDHTLRESALHLIDTTELNALVIDVKGDRGRIPYKSTVPLSAQIGAQDIITIKDIQSLLKSLREKGTYAIARIVVFKDGPLASARPDLAVKRADGTVWRDREGLAWTDPFKREAWDYNLAIAEEVARYGFDEIQFDYTRFPDAQGLVFSAPNTEENRVKTIAEFLRTARKRLTRVLELGRYGNRPDARRREASSRLPFADALPIGVPCRYPRLPRPGGESLRNRLSFPCASERKKRAGAGAFSPLAASLPRLRL
jgi:hypothetical protein